MLEFETEVLDSINFAVPVYIRYVDNMLLLLPGDKVKYNFDKMKYYILRELIYLRMSFPIPRIF